MLLGRVLLAAIIIIIIIRSTVILALGTAAWKNAVWVNESSDTGQDENNESLAGGRASWHVADGIEKPAGEPIPILFVNSLRARPSFAFLFYVQKKEGTTPRHERTLLIAFNDQRATTNTNQHDLLPKRYFGI
jgi:hypothetical protein